MAAQRSLFAKLVVVVAVTYLAQSQLPRFFDTCIDGACVGRAMELALSTLIPLAIAALPVVADGLLFGNPLPRTLRILGYGRPRLVSLALAMLIALPPALILPLYARITQSPLALAANWPWIAWTVFLFNGIVEESLFRGFVFGRLRRERTFWQAASLSAIYFGPAHLPLLVTLGPAIGAFGIALAIPTAYVTAYLFERGVDTLWGPALFHALTNTIPTIVLLPSKRQGMAASLYLAASLVVNLVVMAWLYRRSRRTPVLAPEPVGL